MVNNSTPAPLWALPLPQSIPGITRKVPSALKVVWAGVAGGLVFFPSPLEQGVCPGEVLAPQLLLQSLQEGLWWEQGGLDRSGLSVTLSAKQRGGCQGGATHLESPLVSATPKSKVTCIPLTKSRVLSCLFRVFFNLKLWFLKHFVFLSRHLLHVICQGVSVKTPASSPHGTQLQNQPLQLVLLGAGWTHSTLKHNQVLTRSLSKFWQLLGSFQPHPQLDSLHGFF